MQKATTAPSKKRAPKQDKKYTLPAGHALVLRCCAPDMSSQNGFVWPCVGETAEAPDWENTNACGRGLHGWLYGQGDHFCTDYWTTEGAKWLAVEVEESNVVMLGGKCKFPRGVVRFVGQKHEAAAFIIQHEPRAKSVAVIGAVLSVGDGETVAVGSLGTATAGYGGTATAGDRGTATAGYRGTATAGDSGTATAGYRGTATAGDRGTATAGDSGTATAGDRGTANAGDSGTATAGYSGTATAGDRGTANAGDSGTATAGYRGTATAGYSGTANAGDSGTATAGDRGTATAGYSGTATAGYRGTATAGEFGTICIQYWDEKANRYRVKVGYIGEDGLLQNVAYRLNDKFEFVEAV